MVLKAEAEKVIRHLAIEWMHETGYEQKVGCYPSFLGFRSWLEDKGYGRYLEFKSQIAPRHIAQGWFEDEIRKYWQARGWPHEGS